MTGGAERVSEASKNPAKMSLYPSLEDLKVDKVIQVCFKYFSSSMSSAIHSDYR